MNKCESCYNMECVFVDNQIPFFDSENCQNYRGLTNADRIRQMTDEELADYHTKMCGCPPGHDPIFCGMATIGCKGCWLSWLKATVEEVQDGT